MKYECPKHHYASNEHNCPYCADVSESNLYPCSIAWISVDDQLPAIGQRVILYANNVVQNEIYMLDAGDVSDYAPVEYFWARDDMEDCPAVKNGQYWMKLPEPPKQ